MKFVIRVYIGEAFIWMIRTMHCDSVRIMIDGNIYTAANRNFNACTSTTTALTSEIIYNKFIDIVISHFRSPLSIHYV